MNDNTENLNSEEEQHAPNRPSYDDVLEMTTTLAKTSGPDQVADVLRATALAELDPVAENMILIAIQGKTKLPKKPLRLRLRMIQQEAGLSPNDAALAIARKVRNEHFGNGAHLVRCVDRNYMRFEQSHWVETTDEHLLKLIFEEANKCAMLPESGGLASVTSEAKRCLDYLLGTDEDVMGFNDDPSPVVNCANGEVWIEADGTTSKLPHRPESRLTYCLPISYDPDATCCRS